MKQLSKSKPFTFNATASEIRKPEAYISPKNNLCFALFILSKITLILLQTKPQAKFLLFEYGEHLQKTSFINLFIIHF